MSNASYVTQIQLKQHQAEMLGMLQNDCPRFDGKLLDIGCANGIFLSELMLLYPKAEFYGVDIDEELVEIAWKRLYGKNFSLSKVDISMYEPGRKFDIICASGVLSLFDDFKQPLAQWLSWLKVQGSLYIFGRFNTADVDVIIKYRTDGEWQSGLTAYSLKTVGEYLKGQGLEYRFKRFLFQGELPKSADPIRTYTVPTPEGVIVLNDANIVAEHYFLTIKKEAE